MSGLDVDALLGQSKRTKISPDNSIPEFKQLLASTDDDSVIDDASRQMGQIIQNLISKSFGDHGYGRAEENLRAMREGLKELDRPDAYNDFMRSLKEKLAKNALGGPREDMWWRITTSKLGLISSVESEVTDLTEQEAKDVSTSTHHIQVPTDSLESS